MDIFQNIKIIIEELLKDEDMAYLILDNTPIKIVKKVYTKEKLQQQHLLHSGDREYTRYTINVEVNKVRYGKLKKIRDEEKVNSILTFIEYCQYYIKDRKRTKIRNQDIWIRKTKTGKLSIRIRIYRKD